MPYISPTAAGSTVTPACPKCQSPDHVQAIPVTGVAPGIQYYRCRCGAVWALNSSGVTIEP